MEPRAATAKTPTCAISAERRHLAAGPRARGFTLIELVVALALAALVVALVPPSMEKLRDGMRYRDTVRTVVVDLRKARHLAAADGRDVRFVVDLQGRRFGIEGRDLHVLPEPLQMRLTVAGIEWDPARVGAIRFLSGGGATGGSVDVLRPQGGGVSIVVDWLSASVSQSPLE